MYKLKIKNEKRKRTEKRIGESREKKEEIKRMGRCQLLCTAHREEKAAHMYVEERNKIQACMHVEKKSMLQVRAVSE